MSAQPIERVTVEAMQDRIASIDYTVLAGSTVTICSITLDNGYSVRGESACVDPRAFDEALGRLLAYEDAFRKLWPLFGFLLAEKRFREGRA